MRRLPRLLSVLLLTLPIVSYLADRPASFGHGKIGIAYAKDGGGAGGGSGSGGGGTGGDVHVDFAVGGTVLDEVEPQLITEALHAVGWNRTKAAQLLGIAKETLRYRMEKYQPQGPAAGCASTRKGQLPGAGLQRSRDCGP